VLAVGIEVHNTIVFRRNNNIVTSAECLIICDVRPDRLQRAKYLQIIIEHNIKTTINRYIVLHYDGVLRKHDKPEDVSAMCKSSKEQIT